MISKVFTIIGYTIKFTIMGFMAIGMAIVLYMEVLEAIKTGW
jgi:hypothetical protein